MEEGSKVGRERERERERWGEIEGGSDGEIYIKGGSDGEIYTKGWKV